MEQSKVLLMCVLVGNDLVLKCSKSLITKTEGRCKIYRLLLLKFRDISILSRAVSMSPLQSGPHCDKIFLTGSRMKH